MSAQKMAAQRRLSSRPHPLIDSRITTSPRRSANSRPICSCAHVNATSAVHALEEPRRRGRRENCVIGRGCVFLLSSPKGEAGAEVDRRHDPERLSTRSPLPMQLAAREERYSYCGWFPWHSRYLRRGVACGRG